MTGFELQSRRLLTGCAVLNKRLKALNVSVLVGDVLLESLDQRNQIVDATQQIFCQRKNFIANSKIERIQLFHTVTIAVNYWDVATVWKVVVSELVGPIVGPVKLIYFSFAIFLRTWLEAIGVKGESKIKLLAE